MDNSVWHRSSTDNQIGGVCGGLGEMFGVNPTIFRVLFVALALGYGVGLLPYIVMWIAVPKQ